MSEYYIAACVFTSRYPELSQKVQAYAASRGIEVVRCCVPKYKLREFTEKMPAEYQSEWAALPDYGPWGEGDTVYSICHNCTAVLRETKPEVELKSIWELIDADPSFALPDMKGTAMFVQDCWRSNTEAAEQDAVRSILRKMNVEILEQEENREATDFCGYSLYQPQPKRNPVMAPHRFVELAQGKFQEHTEAQKQQLMSDYCARFGSTKVLCYCHYCLAGLKMGGANAAHLAQLLF